MKLKHVSFAFSKDQPSFFEDISISFVSPGLNFIYGNNGVGKSTFFRIIAGNIRLSERISGKICIENVCYEIQKPYLFDKKIACIGQNYNAMLINDYTFKQNLQCALMPKFPGLSFLSEEKELPFFIDKYGINTNISVSLLSGGQRQILSILMNLQRIPEVLLLDEPIAALDEENTQLIMQFLQELAAKRKITIILIIHNTAVIKQYGKEQFFELKKDISGKRIVEIHAV